MRRAHRLTAATIVMLSCACVWAATPGFVTRKADLRTQPSFSGRVTHRLQPGVRVSLEERRGGWQNVTVEQYLDLALSVDTLIDPYLPLRQFVREPRQAPLPKPLSERTLSSLEALSRAPG